jgi:cell division septum initiation protein DivIVA
MDDLREQISQLEAQIEDHAEAIERCRKFILAAQAAIAVGAFLILGLLIRVIRFDPLVMVCGLTAVMGGIVVLGSNRSTAHQKTAAMKSADALRTELIGRINLRVIQD